MHTSLKFAIVLALVVVFLRADVSRSATGDHVATPPSGTITVVGPNATYNWAAKNESQMWVDLKLVADDVDYFKGIGLKSGNYVDASWSGGTKGKCAPAIHATATDWFATGTGLTTISATLRDATGNAQTDDINPVVTLASVVGGFSLDATAGSEVSGCGGTVNTLAVTAITSQILWLCPGNTQFELAAQSSPTAGDFRSLLRFKVDEAGASPASGHFGGADPVVTRGTGAIAIASSGIDLNRDGTMPGSHFRHQFYVRSNSFSGALTKAQRTTAPAESLLVINVDEHFETGSTFYFELVPGLGAALGGPRLRHRLVKFTSGTVVLDGVGTSFSRVFGASDVDRLQVTFYCDCNGNGALNVGESFAGTYIWVQPLTIHAETVKASTLSGFTAGSQVRSWADASLQSARRKDTNSDFRSCFDVTISSFATFVPSRAIVESCGWVALKEAAYLGLIGLATIPFLPGVRPHVRE